MIPTYLNIEILSIRDEFVTPGHKGLTASLEELFYLIFVLSNIASLEDFFYLIFVNSNIASLEDLFYLIFVNSNIASLEDLFI